VVKIKSPGVTDLALQVIPCALTTCTIGQCPGLAYRSTLDIHGRQWSVSQISLLHTLANIMAILTAINLMSNCKSALRCCSVVVELQRFAIDRRQNEDIRYQLLPLGTFQTILKIVFVSLPKKYRWWLSLLVEIMNSHAAK